MSPEVSICIPAYKARGFLGETLESIRAQTFSDWELILVEDGSDDGTSVLIEQFAESVTQPVRYLRHESNQGLPATRTTGFSAARGRWIAIMDADDLWTPGHLADLTRAAAETGRPFAFSSSQIFESTTGRHLELRGASELLVAEAAESLFRGRLVIQPSSVMFERSLVDRFGSFSGAFPICNDLEFWLRLTTGGVRIAHTGNASCLYRKHAGAMSMKSAQLIAEAGAIMRLYRRRVALPKGEARREIARRYWSAARIARGSQPLQACRWGLAGVGATLIG